jgi:DNA-binding FadR family transcriptional regulator/DNA-binding LacI/PurR family transcriptional regulator
MARPHTSAVLQKLSGYLAALIEDHRVRNDPHLPPLRALAAVAGVSYPTMQRALAGLVQSGVLIARQGSGIVIRDIAPLVTTAHATPRRPTAQEVSHRIGVEVLSGRWGSDESLPSLKELRSRYGVSHRVLRAALRELVPHGYLEPWRRGYRVRPLAIRSDARTIALVLRGGPDNEVVYPSARSQDELRSLEIECTRAGVRLTFITADPISGRWGFPDGNDWVLYRPTSGPGLLGYIVWTSSIDEPMLVSLAPRIGAAGCPIAVLDEGSSRPRMAGYLPRSRSRHFAIAHSAGAGRGVGRMLLQQGHRRVGWLATAGDALWSSVRLTGLREVYAAAGMSDSVVELPLGELAPVGNVGALLGALLRLLEREAPATSRRSLEPMAHMLRRNAETIRVMSLRDARERQYGPLLVDAFAESSRRGCTAWVAESDGLALGALAFLRSRGIRVPQDISIVGYDNSREASEQGLSSYSLNGPAYMHAMLRWVLGAAPSLRERRQAPVEFEGFVVERSTTGRAVGVGRSG